MKYGVIKYNDIANGSGVRTSLFVSGCHRHCIGCFSPETWDFSYGEEFTASVKGQLLNSLKPDPIAGLSLLGGEPLAQENRKEILHLLQEVREQYPTKNVWIFTGYTYHELMRESEKDPDILAILDLTDVLKCGPFREKYAEPGLLFRGSRNQKLIDVNASRICGFPVEWMIEEEETYEDNDM